MIDYEEYKEKINRFFDKYDLSIQDRFWITKSLSGDYFDEIESEFLNKIPEDDDLEI